jgi:hypothetical protein
MRNQNLSDADLMDYSAVHLLYEFQYLWFSAKEVRQFRSPQSMSSVLIESFGIHLRNLIDFFCTPTGSEQPDDVIASDYCLGWSEPLSSTLKTAKERVNKELSHLTLKRKSERDPSKPWNIDGLYTEVMAIAQRFVSQASSAKLSPDIGKWLSQGSLPTVLAVLPVIMATNTTSMMTSVVSIVKTGP